MQVQASSLCVVTSHSCQETHRLYRCQELTQSPVEQPASCDDVHSYCIWTSVSSGDVGSMIMSAMYRAAAIEWLVRWATPPAKAVLSRGLSEEPITDRSFSCCGVTNYSSQSYGQHFRRLQLAQSILSCCDDEGYSIWESLLCCLQSSIVSRGKNKQTNKHSPCLFVLNIIPLSSYVFWSSVDVLSPCLTTERSRLFWHARYAISVVRHI